MTTINYIYGGINMSDSYVVNIFWSDSGYSGGKVYVLYSDNTWEEIRTKHSIWMRNDIGTTFKQHCNLRVLGQKKYTKEQTRAYIEQKDKEFISWKEGS